MLDGRRGPLRDGAAVMSESTGGTDQTGNAMGGMGHGSGLKGLGFMILCCLPMIVILVLLAVGLIR